MHRDWLARRARLSPGAPAILDLSGGGDGGRVVDYAALDRGCSRLANWLRGRGVERGDRVAILAKNRLEYVQLWFACGRLGAIMQALNWRLTARELGPLIERAAPRLLLWDRDFAAVMDELGGIVDADAAPVCVGLDTPDFDLEGVSDARPPALELEPDAPWVLCYTGGTTGLPKAAILTHASVTWNAINTISSWGLSARDVAILNAPMFHTGGLNVFTAPLLHVGGCSILCRGFELDQVFELLEDAALRDRPVSCFFGVPAMFAAMQAHPRWAGARLEDLRILISGGAPCPMPVFEAFWARGVPFKTGYGLTEAGPNNFWLPDDRVRDKPGAVGWPLLHVETRIVDEQGRGCGAGEVGELWIRGPHLSPGYWGDAEATAASFVEGWLHTGDLASADAEGCVSIVGRSKDMYISGGENVYPAEIESVITGHPQIAEAAVIGVADARWGEVGRAFVVLEPGEGAKQGAGAQGIEAQLREFLLARLAKYKVPKSFVVLEALPRTGPGKIDKRALRDRGAPTS